MDFSEIIGQDKIKQRLMQTIAEDRVQQALLLCGDEGVGKLALALAYASELLTKGTPSMPVTISNAEAMIRKWEHPDLHFVYPIIRLDKMKAEYKPTSDDFARPWHEMVCKSPYFSFTQWMEAMGATNKQAIITTAESDSLTRKLSLKSSMGGYKVVIIWKPERAHEVFSNKILKLLEEPPKHTVFLLVSQEPESLLETIRSRTQRIDVPHIDEETIRQALIEQRGLQTDDATRIAHMAHGSWLHALEFLSADNERGEFLQQFASLMRLCYARNLKGLKTWCDTIAAMGREKEIRLFTYFMQQVRENFIYNFHQPELNFQTKEEDAFSSKFARFINEKNVIEINELFQQTQQDIEGNAKEKIVLFDMALQLIVLLLR